MIKYYTAKEIAEMLKVDIQTVFRWLREGQLESHKINNMYRVTQEQLDEFMNKK